MKIGIIGIGLIGSSLARAFLAETQHEIIVYDTNIVHLKKAKELHLATHYTETLTTSFSECDLIFICVPVDQIVPIVETLTPQLKPGCILTDVGSVKSRLLEEISAKLPATLSYIPGHPIAGTEFSGPEAGSKDLFRNKPYFLLKPPQHSKAYETVHALLSQIGANVFSSSVTEHDRLIAFTSHLPHLCAFAAMHCHDMISQETSQKLHPFEGGSFRDFTRVAASNVAMWQSIFLSNEKPIREVYKLFRQELDHLISLLEPDQSNSLENYIREARDRRLQTGELTNAATRLNDTNGKKI